MLARRMVLTVTQCWNKVKSSCIVQAKKSIDARPTQGTSQLLQRDAEEAEDSSEYTPDTSQAVPQQISERVLRRIILFSGLPTLAGLLSLPLFYYLKVAAANARHDLL